VTFNGMDLLSVVEKHEVGVFPEFGGPQRPQRAVAIVNANIKVLGKVRI